MSGGASGYQPTGPEPVGPAPSGGSSARAGHVGLTLSPRRVELLFLAAYDAAVAASERGSGALAVELFDLAALLAEKTGDPLRAVALRRQVERAATEPPPATRVGADGATWFETVQTPTGDLYWSYGPSGVALVR